MAPYTVSLRYFLVLAQELNFTRAAARIGIAQPALSARMRRLEAELGTALLVRNTRNVVLTTAGAALAESAPPALAICPPACARPGVLPRWHGRRRMAPCPASRRGRAQRRRWKL